MIRSILSGVSGMRTHQVRMDVIGDNISNVNTTGFKASRANFQTTLSQTLRSGGGGRNPAQVGTGMSLASISGKFEQGALQATGRTLDIAIEGNGFYQLQDAAGNVFYTREGTFFVDTDGYVVNSNGLMLCDSTGVPGTPGAPIQIDMGGNTIDYLQIGQNGVISGRLSNGDIFMGDTATAAGFLSGNGIIGLTTFPNPEGLLKYGQTLYKHDETMAGEANTQQPGTTGFGTLNSGYLEMSNVDLTDEFANMITTQRGYQANARIITVSDTLLEELIQLKR